MPRSSIPDHITFDGKPIYFPGTVDDYENQGGIWWPRPPIDDHYYFAGMAWHLAVDGRRCDVITERVGDLTVLERLDLAFSVPRAHPDAELVWCGDDDRAVSFGFVDTIIHTDDLLFGSLLRCQAARQMAQLHELAGDPLRAKEYAHIAASISTHLARTFAHPSGLLQASTGKSAQPDVWGSAYAVYSAALPPAEALAVCRALLDVYRRGTIAYRGNIRHVPTDADYDASTAWELTIGSRTKENRYQNGAYWGTATGWVAYALAQVDAAAALELASEYIAELQMGDYRQGEEFGSPFECFHPDGGYTQNPVYMASVTCPLEAFGRLRWMASAR